MASFSQEDVVAGRVISEDDDFMVIELGKHGGVEWTVKPLPGESQMRFETLLFCQFDEDEGVQFVKPWERD